MDRAPVSGANASYEEVNVASGTWDLMFGLRSESYGPIQKVAIVRGHPITSDASMDVNLDSAFTPGSRSSSCAESTPTARSSPRPYATR
jgi:hypothetical protein